MVRILCLFATPRLYARVTHPHTSRGSHHAPLISTQMRKVWSAAILNPADTYTNPDEWAEKASKLAGMFVDNFQKFTDTPGGESLVAAGPTLD